MEIDNLPIYQEIQSIINDGPKPVYFTWTAIIHVGEDEFEAIKLIDIDFKKDYVNNFSDEILLRLLIPYGLWGKVIYPNRTKLEITLIRKPIEEVADVDKKDEDIESIKYTAVPLVTDRLPIPTGKEVNTLTMREMDMKSVFPVDFQLFDKSIERLRMVTVGGIFRRTSAADVIKSVLATESAKVKIKTGKTFEGVDIVEPDNKEKREHVLVPYGTKIYDLADYAQFNIGGVYSTGINCYFHNKYWFVYPLFNTARLDKAKKTAVILKVPKNRYTGIERTYKEDGDTLYILGTSDSDFTDDAGTNFLQDGNAVRFADSRRFLRDIIKKGNNKAIISRSKVNHEFSFKKHEDDVREDELQNSQLSRARINSNPFSERSSMASKYGAFYIFHWENADPSLLFPGMMIKIHFLDKNVMKELHGVLLFAHSSVQMKNRGITSNRHICSVMLTIFANNPPGSVKAKPEDESDENGDIKETSEWTKYKSV